MKPIRRDLLLLCVCVLLFIAGHWLPELIMPAAGTGVLG